MSFKPPSSTTLFFGCLLVAVVTAASASTRLLGLVVNSLLLSGAVCLVAIPIGAFLALMIAKTTLPGRTWLRRCLLAMLLVPLFVQGAGWQAAFGPSGWLLSGTAAFNQGLLGWGWVSTIAVHAVGGVAWVALILEVALRAMPRELEESALQDASPASVLLRVTLPRCGQALGAAALWLTAICFTEISVTDLFQVRTFAEEVYTAASIGSLTAPATTTDAIAELSRGDLGRGLMLATLLFGAGLLALARYFRHADLWSDNIAWRWPLGSRATWLSLVSWCLLACVVGIPLLSLAAKAGVTTYSEQGQITQSWSALKAAQLILRSPWEHRREIGWSLAIGVLAAGWSTTIAFALAVSARFQLLPLAILYALVTFLFVLPGPLLGVWIITLLNHANDSPWSWLNWWYDYTILAPVLAQGVRALPLATLLLCSQLAYVPQDLLDSSRSEGASRWQILSSIIVPLCWPGLAAGFGLALLIACGELAATLLVLPPGVTTLATRIFGLLHYGAEDRVAAICLGLAIVTAAGSGVVATLLSQAKRNLDKCETRRAPLQ